MTTQDLISLIALFLNPVWAAFGVWFGSRLQRQSVVRQIHYAKLHESRAGVLEELYRLVVEARRAFPLNVPIPAPEKIDEQGYKFLVAWGDLRRYYEEKELWLDDEIKHPLDRYLEETETLLVQFGEVSFSLPLDFRTLSPEDMREMPKKDPEAAGRFAAGVEEIIKERKRIAGELEALRAAVETEFRKTLKG